VSATAIDTLREVEQFMYREARLADEHAYDEWESLWIDDGVYWVPFGADDADPETQMSVIYDNRSRIATRIKQFNTGKRHSATPPPRVRRVISNVELLGDDPLRAGANFVVYESRERGITLWAGRVEYTLARTVDGEMKMARKAVFLVNNDRPLDTLSFLI
jgi:benzoate/toluate 1,2-dioxygenase beta subunit